MGRGGQEKKEDPGQQGGEPASEPSGGPSEGHPGRPSAKLGHILTKGKGRTHCSALASLPITPPTPSPHSAQPLILTPSRERGAAQCSVQFSKALRIAEQRGLGRHGGIF